MLHTIAKAIEMQHSWEEIAGKILRREVFY
jgi:hypothetical protein